MKIYTIPNHHTAVYDINTPEKFDLLDDGLIIAARVAQDHKVLNNMTIPQYLGVLRKQLETKYPKFKFLAGIDTETTKINSYMAMFIARDDNQHDVGLIYGAYFKPGLLKIIMPVMITYLDIWAAPFGCQETTFSTERKNPEAYERLLKQFEFHPTHTIFKRKIKEFKFNVQT